MKKFKFKKENKGFTLIELLVSIAIFAIVLVVMLGAILSIMDANRKARSLSLIMNNLDLAIESMTRTMKTGDYVGNDFNSVTIKNQNGEIVVYSFDQVNKNITREVDSGISTPITSPEIEIEDFKVDIEGTDLNNQPRYNLRIKGKAKVGARISSDFNIQTTVSQRNLNI